MDNDSPRITIEVTQDLKDNFQVKLKEDGYTAKGLIVRWIKDYLKKRVKDSV